MSDLPFEGDVLLVAAAKASVPAGRLPELVRVAQTDLRDRLEDYRRRHELVHEDEWACFFLVPEGHWETVGDRLGLTERERSALARAHAEQLLWTGRRIDRRGEFETALEIRDAAVVGRDPGDDEE